MLNSEEVKLVAITLVELCLARGINHVKRVIILKSKILQKNIKNISGHSEHTFELDSMAKLLRRGNEASFQMLFVKGKCKPFMIPTVYGTTLLRHIKLP